MALQTRDVSPSYPEAQGACQQGADLHKNDPAVNLRVHMDLPGALAALLTHPGLVDEGRGDPGLAGDPGSVGDVVLQQLGDQRAEVHV